MTDSGVELKTTLDFFAFETKIMKTITNAMHTLEELVEENKREVQYLQVSGQYMATQIDDLDKRYERVAKKSLDIYDVKSKIQGNQWYHKLMFYISYRSWKDHKKEGSKQYWKIALKQVHIFLFIYR